METKPTWVLTVQLHWWCKCCLFWTCVQDHNLCKKKKKPRSCLISAWHCFCQTDWFDPTLQKPLQAQHGLKYVWGIKLQSSLHESFMTFKQTSKPLKTKIFWLQNVRFWSQNWLFSTLSEVNWPHLKCSNTVATLAKTWRVSNRLL